MTRRRLLFVIVGLVAVSLILFGIRQGNPLAIHHFASQI
jgi:hypothetical protein